MILLQHTDVCSKSSNDAFPLLHVLLLNLKWYQPNFQMVWVT